MNIRDLERVTAADFLRSVADLIADDEIDTQAIRDAEARRKRAENLRVLGDVLPSDDAHAIVHDELKPSNALQKVRRFLTIATGQRRIADGRPLRYLVLLGPPGTGKTLASCWLLAQLSGRYVTAGQLARTADSYTDRREFDAAVRGSCVLIVDDLFASDASGSRLNGAVWEVVNTRQSRRCLTIMTSNATESEFRSALDKRTIDRIDHQGWIATVRGSSMRRGPLVQPGA